MKFSDFFYHWLYGPEGYYTENKNIGKKGDFYTAVSASKYFGGSIGSWLVKRIEAGALPKDTVVCEIGADKGYLLADMVQFIYTLKPELLQTLRFVTVERFESVRQMQREYFAHSFGDAVKLEQVADLSQLSEPHGFVVANEILDAFPCELVWKEQMAEVEDFGIIWKPWPEAIRAHCEKYGIVKGEIGVGYDDLARSIAGAFEKCEFVTFDYGDMAPRNDFSLRIYKEHNTFPYFEADVPSLYKNSDLTYDVHFGHVKEVFEEAGFRFADYAVQSKALEKFGLFELMELLQKNVPHETFMKEAGKIKQLIHPEILGERFKMIRFEKGL